jgi:acyltransferase
MLSSHAAGHGPLDRGERAGAAAEPSPLPPGPSPGQARLAWLDNARGIGICLVVLGHALNGGFVHDVIFAFHMPLFFFLSGLTAPAVAGLPLRRHAVRLARSLLVPFAFFGAVTLTYNAGARWIERSQAPGWDDLLRSAGAIAYGISEWIPANGTLWFFPCLFLTAVGSLALARAVGTRAALGLTLGAAAAMMTFGPGPIRLPWSADSAVIAAPFLLAGMALGTGAPGRWARPGRGRTAALALIALAVIALAITTAVAVRNGSVNINELTFGNPLLYGLGAASGIVGSLALALALPPSGLLRRLSLDSRVIFPIHLHVFGVMTLAAVILLRIPYARLRESAAMLPPYLLLGLLAPIPVAWILRRLMPWAIGERTAGPAPRQGARPADA